MTNDTSTLNGALQELGETMASNLVTKGVTGATANDGLTTLAGKILLVPSSGGTSTVATLELITNKNILSYYDSETATLTITAKDSNNNPVTNETIYLYKNNIAIGTVTTNNNGIAGYTYNSSGIGDITIVCATNSAMSNNIMIEDCIIYDTLTTDNNLWYGSETGMTYTNNGLYLNAPTWSKMAYKNVLQPNTSISIDIVNYQTSEPQDMFFEIYNSLDTTNGVQYNHPPNVETIRFDVSTTKMKVYRGNTLAQTSNHSYSQFYWKWWCGGSRKVTIANLKIKPL